MSCTACESTFMRASVSDRSSHRSGSSSTISARGLAIGGSGLFPALRVGEHDAEDAAAAGARLVHEQSAVALREFAGDEEAESRAARARREERLEDAVG